MSEKKKEGKEIVEELESSTKLKLKKIKKFEPIVDAKKDQQVIISEIFEIYGIMFKTTDTTPMKTIISTKEGKIEKNIDLPEKYNFKKKYIAYINSPTYEDRFGKTVEHFDEEGEKIHKSIYTEVGDGMLQKHFARMTIGKYLFLYDKNLHVKWFSKDSSMPFTHNDIIHIFRGASVDSTYTVDKSGTTWDKFRPNLYIYGGDGETKEEREIFARNLLVSRLEEITKRSFAEESEKAAEISEELLPEGVSPEEDYQATFENQRIYFRYDKYNLSHYSKDLMLYLSNNLRRVCTNSNCHHKVVELGLSVNMEENGGLTSVYNETLGIETQIDTVIAKKTRYAYHLKRNTREKCYHKASIDDPSIPPKEMISYDEFQSHQETLENELKCKKCGGTLVKDGLFFADEFVERTIDAIVRKLPVIYVGIPVPCMINA